LRNPIKFKHLNRELTLNGPSLIFILRRKKTWENISKKSAEKNPLNFGKKIPESQEKLPGFSNPKNLRTLFSE
jgi:hypothetical protein